MNEALKVCPGCDGIRCTTAGEQIIQKYVDHVLPKSLYPFLALHAFNLIPICNECNSDEKRAKDPLNHTLANPLSKTNTFYSFGRPAIKEIYVALSRSAGSGRPELRIEEKSGGVSERIKNLDRVFGLEKRWGYV